ncbi:hypothetical protein Pmani_028739 [Petrolisthes manimaculis]|uniref:Uncharacterized protein n=1 Tax=Petrolisthes manimaculis TaxID=1843537 RepID=A0AAE1P0M4_9EUCA|nr:hypothetical protein Pmani_028739 [Petrolisthes manimaculis]
MNEVVEVSGMGEVEVRPQQAGLTLLLTTRKQTLEQCRTSLEKRRPYVYQTLYQNQAVKEDLLVSEEEVRVEDNGGLIELVVRVTARLPAHAARPVTNTLVEKLSDTLTLENLVFGYSQASLSEARVVAGRRAALEARQRAEGMAEAVGGKLGPCLALREDSCSHTDMTGHNWVMGMPEELHTHATNVVRCNVKATFSLLSYGVPKTKRT